MMCFKASFKKNLFLLAFIFAAVNLNAQVTEFPDYYTDFLELISESTAEQPVEEALEQDEVIAEPEEVPEQVTEPFVEPEPEPVMEPEAETMPATTPEPAPETEPEPAPATEPVPAPSPAEEQTSQESEKHEYQALALIRYKNTDSISFKLKFSYIPKPYILGISLAAGFLEYKLIQPFYFGGYLEPHVGIPQKKFPYKYELNGKSINGPLIVGGKLYAPFGICVFPFQENIEFFVEFAPGLSLNMMWDAKLGKDSITSKMYPAFYGMLRTGATYKGFTFFIEGNYDAILGFGVSTGIGYSLNFDLSSTPDYAPSLK